MSEYAQLHKTWSRREAQDAYYAAPTLRSEMAFWTHLAAVLGRTEGAVYKQLCVRWGWQAKVEKTPEMCSEVGCTRTAQVFGDVCKACAWRASRHEYEGKRPTGPRLLPSPCKGCGSAGRLHAKGLCSACYQQERRNV